MVAKRVHNLMSYSCSGVCLLIIPLGTLAHDSSDWCSNIQRCTSCTPHYDGIPHMITFPARRVFSTATLIELRGCFLFPFYFFL